MSLIAQAFAAYSAGVLTSLSPCVYPMLPITVGFLSTQVGSNRKLTVILYALGQSAAFFVLGLVAIYLGEALGFQSQMREVRVLVGVVLFLTGAWLLSGKVPGFLQNWAKGSGKKFQLPYGLKVPASFSAFGIGFGAAFIMSPCTTPVLSGLLALTATSESAHLGIAMLVAYSLGFSSLLILLGLGVVQRRLLPKSGDWLKILNRIGAVSLMIFGVYYALN
jgi:thiol:disulfide interchange protein DsbD